MVNVSFDGRCYIGRCPELSQPITALSLGGLRRKAEEALVRDDAIIVLSLDRSAKRERDARRRGGVSRASDLWPR